MFSLIVTVISIALVAALVFAGAWFGGEVFMNNRAKVDAQTLTNQASQIYAASQLYRQDHQGQWPATTADLRPHYLKNLPTPPDAAVVASLPSQSATPLDLLIPPAYANGVPAASWELIHDNQGNLTFIKLTGAGLQSRACKAVEALRDGKGVVDSVIDAAPIPVDINPKVVYQCAQDSPDSTRNTYFWRVPGASEAQACDSLDVYNTAKGTNFQCGTGTAPAPDVAVGTPGYWVFTAAATDPTDYSGGSVTNEGFQETCPASGVVLGAPQPASNVAQHKIVGDSSPVSATYCIPVTSEEVTPPAEFPGFFLEDSGSAQIGTYTYVESGTAWPADGFDGTTPMLDTGDSWTDGHGGTVTVTSGTYFIMAGMWQSAAYGPGWDPYLGGASGTLVAAGNITGVDLAADARLQLDSTVDTGGSAVAFRTSQPFDTLGRQAPRPWTSGFWVVELYASTVGGVPASGAVNYGWSETCPAGAYQVTAGGAGNPLAPRDPYNQGPATGGDSATQRYCIPGAQDDTVSLAGSMGSGGTLIEVPITVEGQPALLTEGTARVTWDTALWSLRPDYYADPVTTPWSEIQAEGGEISVTEMAYKVATSAGVFHLYAGAYHNVSNYYYDSSWNYQPLGATSWVKVGVSNKLDIGGSYGCVAVPTELDCWGGEGGWSENLIVVAPVVDGTVQPYHVAGGDTPARLRLSITADPNIGAAGGYNTTITGAGLDFTATAMATSSTMFDGSQLALYAPDSLTVTGAKTLALDMPPNANPLGWEELWLTVCISDNADADGCADTRIGYNGTFAAAAAGVDGRAVWANSALLGSVSPYTIYVGSGGVEPAVTGGIPHDGDAVLKVYGGDLCGASVLIEADGLSYPGTVTTCNEMLDTQPLGMNYQWSRETTIQFPAFTVPFTSNSATVTLSRGGESIQMVVALKTINTSPFVVNNRWQGGKYVVLAGGAWQDNNPANLAGGLPNYGYYSYLEGAAAILETYSPDGARLRCTEPALLYVADDHYTLDYNGGSKRNKAWLCETLIPPGSTLKARVKTKMPGGPATGYAYSKWIDVATAPVTTFTDWPVWEENPSISMRVEGTSTWNQLYSSTDPNDFPILDDGRVGTYATAYGPPHATTTTVYDRIRLTWRLLTPSVDRQNIGYTAFVQWPGDAGWTPVADDPGAQYLYYRYWASVTPPAALPPDSPIQFKVVGPDGSEWVRGMTTSGEADWSLPGKRDKPNILGQSWVSVMEGTGGNGHSARVVLNTTMGISNQYWDMISVGAGGMTRVTGASAPGPYYSLYYTDGLSSGDFHHSQILSLNGSKSVWEYGGGWMTTGHNYAGGSVTFREPGNFGREFRYDCTATGSVMPAGWLSVNSHYNIAWSSSPWYWMDCK